MVEIFGMEVNLKLITKNLAEVKKQVSKELGNIPIGVQGAAGIPAGGKGIVETMRKNIQDLGKKIETARDPKQLKQLVIDQSRSREELKKATTTGISSKGILGTIAATAAASLVITKRMLGFLAQSSPYLKGMLEVANRSMAIFFRPFGDALASLIRPFTLLMMKMAIKFLQFSRTPAGEVVSTGGAGALVGGGVGATIGGVVGGVAGAAGGPAGIAAGAFVGAAGGAGIGAAVGAFVALIPQAIQGLQNIGTIIVAWAEVGIEKIQEMIPAIVEFFGGVKDRFGAFFTETLPEFVGSMKDSIIEKWEEIKTFITGIPESIESKWESIKTFFSETVVGWFDPIVNIFKKIADFFGGGEEEEPEKEEEKKEGFFARLRKRFGFQRGLSFVPEDMPAFLHKGEKVLSPARAGGVGAGGDIFRTTMSFPGAVFNKDIDIDSFIRRGDRMHELALRRRARL